MTSTTPVTNIAKAILLKPQAKVDDQGKTNEDANTESVENLAKELAEAKIRRQLRRKNKLSDAEVAEESRAYRLRLEKFSVNTASIPNVLR